MVETLTTVLTEPGELGALLQALVEETGADPAEIVCQILAPWRPDAGPRADVWADYDARERELSLLFTHAGECLPLPISEDLEPVIVGGTIKAYGLRKACAGVWALAPSLLVPGLVHCYIVFHGVPEPAPWERLILLVSA
jgi:hypothetical protein